MTIVIWLDKKELEEKELEAMLKRYYSSDIPGEESLIGIPVLNDEHIFDPIISTKPISEGLKEKVIKVTLREEIVKNFRHEGVYEVNGCSLLVVYATRSQSSICQRIAISGPNLSVVKDAYRKLRSGELRPKESWEISVP